MTTEESKSESPTSVRFTEHESGLVDALSQQWGCSRSDAIRRVIGATADHRVREAIAQATQPQPAPSGHGTAPYGTGKYGG